VAILYITQDGGRNLLIPIAPIGEPIPIAIPLPLPAFANASHRAGCAPSHHRGSSRSNGEHHGVHAAGNPGMTASTTPLNIEPYIDLFKRHPILSVMPLVIMFRHYGADLLRVAELRARGHSRRGPRCARRPATRSWSAGVMNHGRYDNGGHTRPSGLLRSRSPASPSAFSPSGSWAHDSIQLLQYAGR